MQQLDIAARYHDYMRGGYEMDTIKIFMDGTPESENAFMLVHYMKKGNYQALYENSLKFFGREYADRQYPLKSFIKAAFVSTMASDFPVSHIDPMEALGLLVTHEDSFDWNVENTFFSGGVK